MRADAATIDDLARAVAQFRGVIQVAEVAALILSLLIAFNATSINAEERRRDVATMFAYGLPVRRVVRVGVVENTIIGVLGTLAGIGLGVLVLDWIVYSLFPQTFPDVQVVPGYRARVTRGGGPGRHRRDGVDAARRPRPTAQNGHSLDATDRRVGHRRGGVGP